MFAREGKRNIADNITFIANNVQDQSWEGYFRAANIREKKSGTKSFKERHIVLHWLSGGGSRALAYSNVWKMPCCRVNNENGQALQQQFLSRREEQCGVASGSKKICGESVHSIRQGDGDNLSSRCASILHARRVSNPRTWYRVSRNDKWSFDWLIVFVNKDLNKT